MNTSPPFEARLLADWPADRWRDLVVLVAVSGGPDSVALLRALAATQATGPGRLIVAHFNHRLRGAESEADERFVRDLAESFGLEAHVGQSQRIAPAEAGGRAWEEDARNERYQFLERTAGTLGARYIALAHTADDQVETVLHRLIRGTGIAGLAGMPRVRPLGAASLIRPLLGMSRAEVLAYLNDLGQDFRLDRTNTELVATRNRIRQELLPLLRKEYNANANDAILNLARLASEAQQVLEAQALELADRAAVRTARFVEVDCRKLAREPRYLTRECLVQLWRAQGWPEQAMGFAQWQALAELVTTVAPNSGARMLPGAIRAERAGDTLRLTQT